MKIKKAIFPVAGLGTRFLPATKATPKEMLPLVDKPLIQYVVEEAMAAGMNEIIMITGRNKNAIEDHFDRSVELEHILEKKGNSELLEMVRGVSEMCDFIYTRQKEPKGLGHAVLRVKDVTDDEPFGVLLGDDIIHTEGAPVMKQLVDVFQKTGGSPVVAVERVPMDAVSSYGVIDADSLGDGLFLVKSMVEKPPVDKAPSNMAIIGRYILTPEIYRHLEKTPYDGKGELQLTAAINSLITEKKVYALEFKGKRYDAGDKLGYLKATVEFALRRTDLGDSFRQYLKNLKL